MKKPATPFGGFLIPLAAFSLLYALVSFLFSLIISFGIFTIGSGIFFAVVSYLRVPSPSPDTVAEVLGPDFTEMRLREDEEAELGTISDSMSSEKSEQERASMLDVVAHRGACLDAPENSLSAFRLVAERGVKCVELDVSLTKDGVPVVFHDDVVDRVTEGSGKVSDMTFEELSKLELSSKFLFPDKFPAEKVPTLSEALDLCLSLGLRIMIDVKDPSPQVASAVLKEFQRNPELKRKALVSSFFHSIIYQVRSSDPGIVCSMAVRPDFFAYRDYVPGVGPSHRRFRTWWKHWIACILDFVTDWAQYTFTPYFLGLSAILVSQASADMAKLTHWRNQGLRVFVWTLNDPLAKKYCHEHLRVPYLTDTLEV